MRDLTRDEASERQPVARVEPAGPGPSPILALQNTAGNAAVGRLLAPPAATGQLPPPPPSTTGAPDVAMPPLPVLDGVTPTAPSMPATASTAPQQNFLTALAAAQASAMQRLTAAADAEIAGLQASVSAQRQVVDQSLESALGQVREASTAARGQVVADVAATDAALDPAVTAERARAEAWNQTAVTDAGTALRERQDRVTTAAQDRAATARTAATQAAEQSVADANSQAEAARTIGQAKASSVTGDEEEVRSAQAAVSADLARESATRITEGATEAAGVLRGQGEEVAGSLQTLGANVSADLGTHLGGIVDHLGQQAASTMSTLDTSVTQARTSLAGQRDAAVSQIDRGEQDSATALRQEAARRHSALDSTAEQAAEQVRVSVADAARQSEAAVAQAAAFAMSQPLSPQTAAELSDSVCRQLETGFEPAMTGLSQHSSAIQDGLGTMSSDATASLTDAAGQSQAGLRDTAEQGSTAARQVGDQATASLVSTVDQATTAGDTAVTSFAGSLDEHVASAIPGFDDLLGQHEDSLDSQVADVRSRTSEPTGSLEDRIGTAQERARERAERSWLSNQLHDLWETVTSPEFLVGLAVGLAVGALIILTAGTATPFVIMAAGIAAGAAGAAAGTMVGNHRAGRDLTENLFRNMLYGAAAGAVGAAVYLFGAGVVAGLGLTGGAAVAGGFIVLELSAIASNTVMNLLAGEPWDKNLLTAMLLAPLIEIIQARLFGPKGEPPVPGDERPPSPDGPNPEDGPAPVDEDGPGPRRPREVDGPEGLTDEDVHIEDVNEPARDPADPELDPAICFAAGTLVSTPSGYLAIEDVATGDVVHAYDHETKQVVPRTVTATTRGSTTTWAEVRLRHKVIRSTLVHRFWVESLEEWVPAVDLRPGMTVLLVDGDTAEIDSVEQVSVPDKETTYNLSVDEVENYFVGEDGVLVHNITRSRMAHLSRPGYRNYVLRNRAGRIYYSGMFGPDTTPAQVQARHRANHNRFGRGDTFELLPGQREYGASRLLEHRTAVANETIIGRDGENYRGNRQEPLAADKLPEYVEYEQVKRGCG